MTDQSSDNSPPSQDDDRPSTLPKIDNGDFERRLAPDEISGEIRNFDMSASDMALPLIANRLDVPEVLSLFGKARVQKRGPDLVLDGHVNAELRRICVISLEDMTETISEDFTIRYVPELDPMAEEMDETSDVEPMPETSLDLGEIFIQQVALAMASHPRRADAALPADKLKDRPEGSPFEALRALSSDKPRDKNGGNG